MRLSKPLIAFFVTMSLYSSIGLAAGKNAEADRLRAEEAKVGVSTFTSPDYKKGTVRHIVLLRFKSNLSQAQRKALISTFLGLKTHSLHNGREVIAAIETGPQISGEGADHGLQQAFLLTFDSQGDRNYFIGSPIVTQAGSFDPAHDAFKKELLPALATNGIVGFDYPVTTSLPAAH